MTPLRGRCLVAVAALATLAAVAGVTAAQPLFGPTQDPLAGSRVFGEKGCVKCHAVNGVGGKVGPDLGRLPRPRSFFDLAASMWNHLPRMAARMRELGIPRPHLDAREAGDLIAFLFTINYFDPPGDAEAGRRLFVAKKCVVCHQVGGVGGVIGPNLDILKQYGSPIFIAAALWNHGPAMAEVMHAKGIERPTFKATELVDLIAYVRSASLLQIAGPLHVLPGRAAEGHRLFVEKRCSDCHGVAGKGATVGPDLADRGVHQSLTQFAAAMWNKAPTMLAVMKARGIAVPQLRAEEMADIVAYLYAVRYFAQPRDPQRGARLAVDKGCLGCHTVHGRDGKAPIDLAQTTAADSAPGVVAALWNHAFVQAPAAGRAAAGSAELRGDEMADLIAFLRSLRPRRP
jgi:mono/diheme cytochrome c family protein